MTRKLLRTAASALQQVVSARTLEYRIRYTSEARLALEEARRAIEAGLEKLDELPTPASRRIVARALELDRNALAQLEVELAAHEEELAAALDAGADLFALTPRTPRAET